MFAFIFGFVGRWYRREQLRHQLMSMSDRLLADAGIARHDIPAVVAGAYDRAPVSDVKETLVALSAAEHRAHGRIAAHANDDRGRLAA